MFSKITSKFQTTIPRDIRSKLKLTKNDSIEWIDDAGKIIIKPAKNDFLKYRGSVPVGSGNIDDDIDNAKKIRSIKINE
jgi:AbrB family looped-hinge helix DNA binding protein